MIPLQPVGAVAAGLAAHDAVEVGRRTQFQRGLEKENFEES
jgi:hypothetical protein